MNFLEYVFCFFIYAFLGYICEVIYCSIGQKKLVNRGYLYMPICPIYGCGAVLILFAMEPLYNYWYLVLLLGILLTSTLEYLTSLVMEMIFHMRWWDYSKRKFNINGRVCLRNSLLFGGLVMVVIYCIQPLLFKWLEAIPVLALQVITGILMAAMIIDMIFSTIKNINIAKVISKLTEFKEVASDKLEVLKDEATLKITELKEDAVSKIQETKNNISNSLLVTKFKNILDKYPNVQFRRFGKQHKSANDLLDEYPNNDPKEESNHEHH